jgi:hypothetical protein
MTFSTLTRRCLAALAFCAPILAFAFPAGAGPVTAM